MNGEIKGYIVLVCGRPGVLHDYGDCPRGGVLTSGCVRTGAQLFATRKRANTAVMRSIRYARENNLMWRDSDYYVVSVRG